MTLNPGPVRTRIPWWVWLISAGYGAAPPALHAWLKYFPPAGAQYTGLQGADSVVFLHCIRMFATDFYTPFASCLAAHGDHYWGYYAAPFFWMYGVAGAIGRLAGVSEFMTLGLANGVAASVYLLAAYTFMREVLARRANLAFVLFALGGGPGGLLYIGSAMLGWTRLSAFEMYFQRFALSLTEGSYNVMAPRLYYTIPLALCLLGLTLLIRGSRTDRHGVSGRAALLLAMGAFFNLRVGPMAWTAGILYLWFGRCGAARARITGASVLTIAVVAGCALGWGMMSLSPTYAQNALQSVRNSLPFSEFVADAVFYLAVLPVGAVAAFRGTPRAGRVVAGTLAGYLAAFTILYCGYQVYFGNVLVAREYAVTIAISDWALIGAGVGLLWVVRIDQGRKAEAMPSGSGWALVWFMLLFALSISAFGHGWFMRLVPARLLAFMGLPLSLLVAEGIEIIRAKHARLANGAVATILTGGVTTVVVSYACFMGPLDWRADNPAFAWTHCELMTLADAHVIDHIDSGVVLTPYIPGPQFSDVISLRPHCRVVMGMGTLNMSDLDPQKMEAEVGRFFSHGVTEADRRRFLADWCVDYVFCSDTRPADEATVAELRGASWLHVVAEEGRAVLFKVQKS